MKDLISALQKVVEQRTSLPKESLFLLGEPNTYSYDQLQKTISELLFGKKIHTFSIPKLFAKCGAFLQNLIFPNAFIKPWMIDIADDNFIIDISKAKNLLGWSPSTSLLDTLPKIIETLKKDPAMWYKENFHV